MKAAARPLSCAAGAAGAGSCRAGWMLLPGGRGDRVFERARRRWRSRRGRAQSGGRRDIPVVGNDGHRLGRAEGAFERRRVIGLRAGERLLVGRQGIEVGGQDRRIGDIEHRTGCGQPGIVAVIVVGTMIGARRHGIAHGKVVATQAGQRALAVARRALLVLVDHHFELIEAELDAVAVAQLGRRALADRFAGPVEERAVRAEVMQLPVADAVDQPTVPFRQVALRIGDDPFVVLAAAYGKFAAADLAPLGRHVVGTANHDKLEGHVRAHSCDGTSPSDRQAPITENTSRGSLGRAIVFGFVGDWAILLRIHSKRFIPIPKVADLRHGTIYRCAARWTG